MGTPAGEEEPAGTSDKEEDEKHKEDPPTRGHGISSEIR